MHFKRINYLFEKKGKKIKWIRLRTDGRKHTITFKEQIGSGINQTTEYETEVMDFKIAAKILCKAMNKCLYSESTRIPYTLKGAEITIDKAPLIPWYVEVEGKSEKHVRSVQKLLDIKGKDVGNIAGSKVYELYGMDYVKVAKRNDKPMTA